MFAEVLLPGMPIFESRLPKREKTEKASIEEPSLRVLEKQKLLEERMLLLDEVKNADTDVKRKLEINARLRKIDSQLNN